MRRSTGLAVAAGVTFVVGLLTLFPARVAYQWFAPPGAALSGISGSVWKGRAAEASFNGFYVRDLGWSLQPAGLFKGGLYVAVEASPPSGFLDGVVGLSAGGAIILQDLRLSMSLDSLHRFLAVPQTSGNASLRFDRLRIEDGAPTAAEGIGEVAGLAVRWSSSQVLGDFRAEFMTGDAGILGTIEDVNAIVDVAGTLRVGLDRRWELLLLLAANDATPAAMREQLAFVGPLNERGQYEFRRAGQL